MRSPLCLREGSDSSRYRDSMLDFEPFLSDLPALLERRRFGPQFARFDAATEGDIYGTIDAVGIAATLGLPLPSGAAAWINSQARADGSYTDPSHGVIHTTASAIGALFVLGEKTPWPAFIDHIGQPGAIGPHLDAMDWSNPWPASHEGAGLLAIGTMTRDRDDEWISEYFAWLDSNVDPVTGLWPKENIGNIDEWPGLFGNLGCSFHFHFLYLAHGREIPFAKHLVDTCLELATGTRAIFDTESIGYPQLDWAYSLHRASAQAGYRTEEVFGALRDLGAESLAKLNSPSEALVRELADLHTIGAVVALIAELKLALGDDVRASFALTPTTDIRPFI